MIMENVMDIPNLEFKIRSQFLPYKIQKFNPKGETWENNHLSDQVRKGNNSQKYGKREGTKCLFPCINMSKCSLENLGLSKDRGAPVRNIFGNVVLESSQLVNTPRQN